MISKNGFLVVTGIVIILGYLAKKGEKPEFHIPTVSLTQDRLKTNVTLLGTNDLHSTVTGLGLKLYPDMIKGGYSKLVHLIDAIR